jgi:hypothetical protein
VGCISQTEKGERWVKMEWAKEGLWGVLRGDGTRMRRAEPFNWQRGPPVVGRLTIEEKWA